MRKLIFIALCAVWTGGVLGTNHAQATSTPNTQAVAQQPDCDVDVADDVQQIRYDIDATLDWSSKVVDVVQTIYYRNDHDDDLSELVLYSEPHRLSRGNVLTFGSAQDAAGNAITDVLIENDSTTSRITVPLINDVAPNCDVVVQLEYSINVQSYSNSNPIGWLSYTDNQLNLGHWFPTVGVYEYSDDDTWYTPTVHYIGEQFVADVSDISLDFTISGAPSSLVLAAPGTIESIGTHHWQIEHTNTRELALSMSTAYVKHTATVGDTEIEWYIYSNPGEAAVERVMTDATQSMELYSRIFGEYPHDRMVIVEADGFEGYELSGFLFVGSRWFEIWNGNTIHWLTVIGVHEIAHQWWYAGVGNDQGTVPFMDEALATYSEFLYFEEFYPSIAGQWWGFRVNQYTSNDNVDSTVYDYTQWRPYINAAYLNGVRMLHAVRTEIGDDAFSTWLNTYYTENVNTIATPMTLWAALGDAYVLAEPVLTQYLGVVLTR